jgi:Fe-S cluster assembly protein SufD
VRDVISLNGQEFSAGVTLKKVASEAQLPVSQTDDIVIKRIREGISEVLVLEIARDCEIAEPIKLARNNNGFEPQLARSVIKVGANSQATLIIENLGSAILAEEIEIILEPGANFTFITLQEWENDSVHVGRHHAVIGKDATFTSFVVTVGGSVVRLLPTVEYAGPGSSAELNGVYFATHGQHLEHRIHVDHNLPKAKSRVNYKGALSGLNAHTVWIGDVYIHAAAEGTDTYELNRNLLLSDGARADSVPNLEIETGEIVGAGHASTTGRFDDEQLFYLESRGIPAEIARRLVIRGFFAEIISKIRIEAIEERLMARIDNELARVGE